MKVDDGSVNSNVRKELELAVEVNNLKVCPGLEVPEEARHKDFAVLKLRQSLLVDLPSDFSL